MSEPSPAVLALARGMREYRFGPQAVTFEKATDRDYWIGVSGVFAEAVAAEAVTKAANDIADQIATIPLDGLSNYSTGDYIRSRAIATARGYAAGQTEKP